jgi:prepilin-type N-terminal cleavage/methylation domain-containing protein
MNEESGFTIMELMVVIGIIAILCGLAVPSYLSWLPTKRMESAASEVNTAIRVARMSAVKENTSATLQFDVDDESYSITVPGRTVKSGKMPAGVDLTDVFLSNQVTPAAGGSITFDSRGFPTPPVDIVLQNTTGTTWTIQVNMTGSSRLIRG